MYILLAAATKREIQPVIDHLQKHNFRIGRNNIDVLITGVGGVSTTYLLTQTIHDHRPDYILQAGIAGSFSELSAPGAVVFISEELAGDTGVEENNELKDLFDLGLQEDGGGPYTGRSVVNPYCKDWENHGLQFVRGVSVNEITTRPARVQQLQQKYSPAVESMEGLAFHYTCVMESVPFIQIRAISNYVGERDKSKWKMQEAITALNNKLIDIVHQL